MHFELDNVLDEIQDLRIAKKKEINERREYQRIQFLRMPTEDMVKFFIYIFFLFNYSNVFIYSYYNCNVYLIKVVLKKLVTFLLL